MQHIFYAIQGFFVKECLMIFSKKVIFVIVMRYS